MWTVAPDGRVARVVPGPYHVEWYRDGELAARGPTVPFEPVEVTAADREAWHAERARQRPSVANVTGPAPPRGSSGGARSAPRTPGISDDDFPRHFPPFVETYVGHVAMVAPDGALWVMRYSPPRSVPAADVFDAAGRRTLSVELPRGRRLAGIGENALYLVHTDEDGLQWLERYPWSR